MAERGGFEPPVQLLTVQRFSKPPPSATRPSLRSAGCTDYSGSVSVSCLCPRILRKFFSCRRSRFFYRRLPPYPRSPDSPSDPTRALPMPASLNQRRCTVHPPCRVAQLSPIGKPGGRWLLGLPGVTIDCLGTVKFYAAFRLPAAGLESHCASDLNEEVRPVADRPLFLRLARPRPAGHRRRGDRRARE